MTTRQTARCRQLAERLSRFVDGGLDATTRRAIRAHLRRCPCCDDFVTSLRQTVALCRDARQTALPATMRARARARVRHLLATSRGCRP